MDFKGTVEGLLKEAIGDREAVLAEDHSPDAAAWWDGYIAALENIIEMVAD